MGNDKPLKQIMSEVQASLELLAKDANGIDHFQTEKFNHSESLLDNCKQVVSKSQIKPKLRIIHHFACSGGTLVSKCLAALPNVFLFSELHPTSRLHMGDGTPRFLPSDITTHARYASVPNVDDLAKKIFVNNVKITDEHLKLLGGYMVLRDHTHSDFCVGNNMAESSTVNEILADDFDILSIVTLRNPIDSYLSLQKNGWIHFEPASFEEYCKRLVKFLNQFDSTAIVKYEDIVSYPKRNIKKIARKLELPYSATFIENFSAFKVTGDSGRSGDVIAARARRELSEDFEKEISNSKSYQYVADKFGY